MAKTSEPVADLSEFEAAGPRRKKCWFSLLDDAQQAKVVAAKEAGYSATTIAKVVTGWGARVGKSQIGAHFRGECFCG